MVGCVTRSTESLAATARISAHDTVLGQTYSRSAFIASITSNPRKELAFGAAVFSPVKLGVSSSNTDASHPCLIIIYSIILNISN